VGDNMTLPGLVAAFLGYDETLLETLQLFLRCKCIYHSSNPLIYQVSF